MKIYFRYISINLLNINFVLIAIFIMILWLTQTLRYTYLITNSDIGIIDFFKLSLLLIPSFIQIILPISSFIAIIYYYNKIYSNKEIIILKTSGMNNYGIYKPAIFVALIIMLLNYFISFFFMPYCAKNFREKLIDYKNDNMLLFLEEGAFNNRIKSVHIYIEKHLPNNIVKNIFIYDEHDPKHKVTIIAKYANISKNENVISFILNQGNRQELNGNREVSSILYFDQLVHDIVLPSLIIKKNSLEPNERYLNELNQLDKYNYIAELSNRITWPLYNILLSMIALVPFSFFSYRDNNFRKFSLASIIGLIIISSHIYITNAIKKDLIFTIILYSKIILILIMELYILFYSKKYIVIPCKKVKLNA